MVWVMWLLGIAFFASCFVLVWLFDLISRVER